MFLLYTIFMIEPTQEYITKVVENHFDVADSGNRSCKDAILF